MEIVLHLGLHRTGTSALQWALKRESRHLARRGVEIPPTPLLRRRAVAALDLAERPRAFGGLRRSWARARIRALAAEAEKRGARRLVLSDEALIGHMDSLFAPDGPYPAAAERFALLAEALDGWSVGAAAGVRDPADWIASAYAYSVERRALPAFDALRPGFAAAPGRLGAALGAALEAFGSLTLWTGALVRARPRKVMRALAGEGARVSRSLLREQNRALSGAAVEEIVALRARGGRIDEATREALAARHPLETCGPFDPWRPEERAALAGAFAAELARLKARGARMLDAEGGAAGAAGRERAAG